MAVFTNVDEASLEAFLEDYDVGRLEAFSGIAAGSENSNFDVTTSQGRFVLTLYEKRVRVDDLPFFIRLMQHLADKEVHCPKPMRNDHGKAIGRLMDKPATLVTFLKGAPAETVAPVHCRQAGQALAHMHLAAGTFVASRRNDLGHGGWRQIYARLKGAGDIDDDIAGFIAEELDFLHENWPEDLPAGIIHADLFPDNVLFAGDTLSGVIDFYFACRDYLAYDLAIAFNAWCFDKKGKLVGDNAQALIDGYEVMRSLNPEELEDFPVLCRGAALRFLLTRLWDWLYQDRESGVQPLDPQEYARRLQFHRDITEFADYGFE